MKRSLNKLLFVCCLSGVMSVAYAEDRSKDSSKLNLKPYPQAEAAYQRWVIELPAEDPASSLQDTRKVELIIGKTLLLDCNRLIISGELAQRTAEGWGYDYYVLEKTSTPISTRMMCPPDSQQHEGFVALNLKSPLNASAGATQPDGAVGFLRYNAELPIVVYLPEGFELRYRLWQTDDAVKSASKK